MVFLPPSGTGGRHCPYQQGCKEDNCNLMHGAEVRAEGLFYPVQQNQQVEQSYIIFIVRKRTSLNSGVIVDATLLKGSPIGGEPRTILKARCKPATPWNQIPSAG